ncbi:hypothetical protein [Petrimonas mucosa]|uniref:hypothetical protein n=1 Tax=Petrimonas mucosa TaxID=1642646 RepID=UPI0017578146|nr:hypothetical protein [Petrimonas mucosa]HHT28993.1 hypothetical protein [Petrimonas mucosa]
MKTTTILFLLLLLPLQMMVAQTEKAFPNYVWSDANATDKDGSRFGYEKASFTPVMKDCHALPKSDPCYEADNYNGKTLLGKYKNASMTDYVNILYAQGPSMDPMFAITDKHNNLLWSENGEEMCINSSGVIYLSGNMDKMFNQRMKFQFANNKVTEVKQPYYFVDVKGKLLKPVKLYSRKDNRGELIATLPVGYEIEVLLADPDTPIDSDGYREQMTNYLARTAFGLVGWLKLGQDDTYFMDPVVKGLGFYGD